jgi:hypothetical protein
MEGRPKPTPLESVERRARKTRRAGSILTIAMASAPLASTQGWGYPQTVLHQAGWRIALRPLRETWRPVRTKGLIRFQEVYEQAKQGGMLLMTHGKCTYTH